MRFFTVPATVLGLASTTFAATAGIVSHCTQDLYLMVSTPSGAAAPITIAPNGTYTQPLAGSGNQFGISKLPNYYDSTTSKFIFGFSDATASQLTYWSVSTANGDPFSGSSGGSGFYVNTSDPTCTTATTYDGQVHTCSDSANLFVYLC